MSTLPPAKVPRAQPLARRVLDWLSQREVYHIIFWLSAGMMLLWAERPVDTTAKLAAVGTTLGFYAALVYFNLNYLIPTYLTQRRAPYYLLLLLLAAALATPVRALVLYWLFAKAPEIQNAVLANQQSIFLSHLAVASGSTMVKIAGDWAINTRERQRLLSENLESELRFLRSQVNPHFLFNTLNSLYALTLKKSDRAPETVLKLSDMMRYMLYDSHAAHVPLEKEVEYVRNYLSLEQLRYGEKADIRFEVKGEITDQVIAPMLFITFVENCFKHGLAKVFGNGYVHIVLLIEGQQVRFHLENARPQYAAEDANEAGGIGLLNAERRLELLYPDRHELTRLAEPKAYSVDLYLNLNTRS